MASILVNLSEGGVASAFKSQLIGCGCDRCVIVKEVWLCGCDLCVCVYIYRIYTHIYTYLFLLLLLLVFIFNVYSFLLMDLF